MDTIIPTQYIGKLTSRCTGYVKIIEAVWLAAARLRGEEPSQEEIRFLEHSTISLGEQEKQEPQEHRVLGKSIWDLDGPAKADGTLAYCGDLVRKDRAFPLPVMFLTASDSRILSLISFIP